MIDNRRNQQLEGFYLISLLSAVITGAPPPEPPDGVRWERILKLARRHQVANTAYYAVLALPEEQRPLATVLAEFQKDHQIAVAKEATQHIEINALLNCLSKERIDIMALKGWHLKYLYPKPDMRLMADIDLLVKTDQLQAVSQVIKANGFEVGEHLHGEFHAEKKPFLHIEVHTALVKDLPDISKKFTWERYLLTNGSEHLYEMTREDSYVYLIAHIYKHFQYAGSGLRPLMDYWLYRRKYGKLMDWTAIQHWLEQTGLMHFSQMLEKLSGIWFDGNKRTEELEQITLFILSNGAYGTDYSCKMVAFSKSVASGSTFKKTIRRDFLEKVFLNIDGMQTLYPSLKKFPWLLSLFWIRRIVSAGFMRRQRVATVVRDVQSVDPGEVSHYKEIREKMGLRGKKGE